MESGETGDSTGTSASPEQIVSARERLAAIYEAVDELPFRVKQAFLLHRRSGLTYGEIADQLGVSVSSVEKYILQALQHCRDRLTDHAPKPGPLDENQRKS